jgi:putative restriction endonuclease
MSIENHIEAFTKLSRNKNKEKGQAPHKPVFLLSLTEAIASKVFTANLITLTPELIIIFKNNWRCFGKK